MKKYICPYCDQAMDSGKYCKGCRKIVWKPQVREVGYYLNERHPAGEADCTYHGDLRAVVEIEPKRGKKKKEKNGTAPKQNSSNRKLLPTLVSVLILLGVFQKIVGGLIGGAGELYRDFRKMEREAVVAEAEWELAEAEAVEAEEVDGEEYLEFSDEEAMALGIPCNLFGHFDVSDEEVIAVVERHLAEYLADDLEPELYSFNMKYGEDLYFDSQYTLYLSQDDSYKGDVQINYDTATWQLHGFTAMVTDGDVDTALALAEGLIDVLRELELYDGEVTAKDVMASAQAASVSEDNPEPGSGYYGVEDQGIAFDCDIFGSEMEYIEFRIRKMGEW